MSDETRMPLKIKRAIVTTGQSANYNNPWMSMAGLYSGSPAYLYGSEICKGINDWSKETARKFISYKIDSILPDVQSLQIPHKIFIGRVSQWPSKFSARTAADWMSARPEFMPVLESPTQRAVQSTRQARFSSFRKGLQDLAEWPAKYSCTEVCMESSDKYWIPVFNVLEKTCWVVLAAPKYTKPQKGNKTDRKDAK